MSFLGIISEYIGKNTYFSPLGMGPYIIPLQTLEKPLNVQACVVTSLYLLS